MPIALAVVVRVPWLSARNALQFVVGCLLMCALWVVLVFIQSGSASFGLADVGVGVIDVKSYYVESPEDVEERIRACLRFVPAERLSVSPDCGLSQTARWASRRKLESLVAGARRARTSTAAG